MNKEEKISLEKLKNMAYDINCIGAEYCKIDEEDMNCNKCLRCAYDTITNYIDKLQKELKDSINARFELQRRIDKTQKENAELKEEIKDLIEENHKHIDYIADMKKKHEDKIRAKIKELEEKCETIKKTYTGTYALNGNYLEAFSQIVILRELLGDE